MRSDDEDTGLTFTTVGAAAMELVKSLEPDHEMRGVQAGNDERHPANDCQGNGVGKGPARKIRHGSLLELTANKSPPEDSGGPDHEEAKRKASDHHQKFKHDPLRMFVFSKLPALPPAANDRAGLERAKVIVGAEGVRDLQQISQSACNHGSNRSTATTAASRLMQHSTGQVGRVVHKLN